MRRALLLVAILAVLGGLAFIVGRANTAPPVVTPYVGKRGASRANASGLGVSLRRGAEVRPLAPGTPVRAGDALHFTVRAEGPRYLIVRMRDGAAARYSFSMTRSMTSVSSPRAPSSANA